MNNLIDLAEHIPTPEATLTVAYTPIRLPMVGRQPLELRLTAPATGGNLPIVVLSHGFGPSNYIPSKDGYAPLAQFWAERGFVVIQPTHASSRVGGLPSDAPSAPFFWRERVEEIKAVLNQLPEVERQAPSVAGRMDHSRVGAAGHSFGGHTVGLLLGAQLNGEDFSDPRISAGILLAAPGRGGKDMTDENVARFPFAGRPDPDLLRIAICRYTPVGVGFGDARFLPCHVGLFGGGFSQRNREHTQGAVRGRACARPVLHHDTSKSCFAAGDQARDPAHDEQLRLDVQGHVACFRGSPARTVEGGQ